MLLPGSSPVRTVSRGRPGGTADKSAASAALIAAIAVFCVVLYFSQAYLYFFNINLTPVAPVHWYLVTLAIALPVLAAAREGRIYIARSRRLIFWAAAWTFILTISLIFNSPDQLVDPSPEQSFTRKEEMVLLLTTFGIIYQSSDALKRATKALVFVTLIGVAINVGEFAAVGGVVFSTVAGRAAGLYEDANLSGSMLVAGMLLSVLRLRPTFRIAYCSVVGIGVLVTFSRSAITLWAIALFGMVAFRWLTPHRKVAAAFVCLGLAGASQALTTGGWIAALEVVGAGDMLNENTRARIGSSFLDQHDFSKGEREDIALRALDDWKRSPIFGNGVGYSGYYPARPHNQYLEVASDLGLVGLIPLLFLLLLLWRSGSQVGVLIAIHVAVSNFFSHNNLELPAVQLAIAMALSRAWSDMAAPADVWRTA